MSVLVKECKLIVDEERKEKKLGLGWCLPIYVLSLQLHWRPGALPDSPYQRGPLVGRPTGGD